jgi:hypothetical protein
VELIRLGGGRGQPGSKALVTVRHHACEMMASYVAEGLIEGFLADSETGHWLRDHVDCAVVPMVDRDGVEDGDQGKNRLPHDHKADYHGASIYPEVAALREFVARWSGGKPDVTFDLHNPALNTRVIYAHALRIDGEQEEGATAAKTRRSEALRFLQVLERVQTGPLPFRVADSLDFAARKAATAVSSGPKERLHPESEPAPEPRARLSPVPITVGFEVPYAVVGQTEVTPASARALGSDLAQALRVYLDGRGAAP